MKKYQGFLIGALFLTVQTTIPLIAKATDLYEVSELQVPSGRNQAIPLGCNSFGVVAGYTTGDFIQPCVWYYGQAFEVSIDPLLGGFVYDVNDQFELAGTLLSPQRTPAYYNGNWEPNLLPSLPDTFVGTSYSINTNAIPMIVGEMYLNGSTRQSKAFAWDGKNGSQELSGLPLANANNALSVNDFGSIVGASGNDVDFREQAVYWPTPTSFPQLLGLPGWDTSYGRMINNWNLILIVYENPTRRTILWNEGSYLEVELPKGATQITGRGINEYGDCVGDVMHNTGRMRAAACDLGGETYYVEDRLSPKSVGWELNTAQCIDDNRTIYGRGRFNGVEKAYMAVRVSK